MSPRRSPSFTRFIGTGAVLGFLLGGLISVTHVFEGGSADDRLRYHYTDTQAVLYVGLLGAVILGLAAAVLAVLLDRRD